ncbi:hypothetical protein PMAN_a1733 [Pseudoalteromonas marina]|nr:hypothetical protein PMAN_a1733 [Pseudoalteromonas marina]
MFTALAVRIFIGISTNTSCYKLLIQTFQYLLNKRTIFVANLDKLVFLE